jgi:hypothetical protein
MRAIVLCVIVKLAMKLLAKSNANKQFHEQNSLGPNSSGSISVWRPAERASRSEAAAAAAR